MKNSVKYERFTISDLSHSIRGAHRILLASAADSSPYDGYIPLAPLKSHLARSRRAEQLVIYGRIFDKSGKWPAGNAGVEIWHLTPGTKEFNHRAKLISDSTGAFQLTTDMPARIAGQNFKIYFKIRIGVKSFFTYLSFNHSMAFLANRSILSKEIAASLNQIRHNTDCQSNYFKVEIRLDN